jgi:F0F1-type ATP synthase epsilon subunit
MGVLKNHAPLITGLDVGAMLIRKMENGVHMLLWRFLIKQNQVTILANEAQSSESINPADAESAFKLQRKEKICREGVKDVEANFAYKRAKARFQVVKLAKNSNKF